MLAVKTIPPQKIQNDNTFFFNGLRRIRYTGKKGIVEAPYPGLLIFHPLRGGFFPVVCVRTGQADAPLGLSVAS
ncbi:hypothetical protein C943_01444 [Mariniradius saccharolyticus AK6]|uniref:Uncharacterized protein n=1 Tax=Mariniradius saccharolyticus AK6 TaxID=1239962 RepID=M7XUL1_9BACT|nr:hypothetical protein C943_01444 [Mariniradius saccharolyticus AK6]